MSERMKEVKDLLNAPIPRSAVSTREGGRGAKLSYLEGWYVIDRLNEIFGPMGWGFESDVQCVFNGQVKNNYDKDVYNVSYIARGRLVVEVDGKLNEHKDWGYGDGQDPKNPGKAHELAVKEASTDALKRCAKNLGMSMGLALYNKTQENVSDEEEAPQPEKRARKPAETKAATPAPAVQPKAAPAKYSAEGKTRAELMELISASSKVVISKGLATAAQIKTGMQEKYNTTVKEELTDEQARELLTSLQEKINNG